MILKIAQYDGSQRAHWKFIDDIGEVSTLSVFLRMARDGDGEEAAEVLRFFSKADGVDLWFPDIVFLPDSVEKLVLSGRETSQRISAVLVITRGKVGQLIAFHEAYLMNDEGKTIERL